MVKLSKVLPGVCKSRPSPACTSRRSEVRVLWSDLSKDSDSRKWRRRHPATIDRKVLSNGRLPVSADRVSENCVSACRQFWSFSLTTNLGHLFLLFLISNLSEFFLRAWRLDAAKERRSRVSDVSSRRCCLSWAGRSRCQNSEVTEFVLLAAKK